jgi:uncharacterized protein (DUF2141 family)
MSAAPFRRRPDAGPRPPAARPTWLTDGFLGQAVAGFAFLLIAALILFPPRLAHAETPQGAPILVEVTGIKTALGAVRVAVCTQETFLTESCPFSGSAAAAKGSTLVTVDGVPPGVYAIQLFQDENDNHRVDRGLLGVPMEAVGFSNDASVGLRGPRFIKAAFVHDNQSQTVTVSLRRFGPKVP